jgi:hypothetical protein
LWRQFGIGEAHAQTSPHIIVYPCRSPEIIGISGARAYWFSSGGFQQHCPTYGHYLMRHFLGPEGDGPWVSAVVVLQTAGTFLVDVTYFNYTEETNCSNPTVERISTTLQRWNGTSWGNVRTWTDPCPDGISDHVTLTNLQAGWNYLRLRIRHVPNQPGSAEVAGFTFRPFRIPRPPVKG